MKTATPKRTVAQAIKNKKMALGGYPGDYSQPETYDNLVAAGIIPKGAQFGSKLTPANPSVSNIPTTAPKTGISQGSPTLSSKKITDTASNTSTGLTTNSIAPITSTLGTIVDSTSTPDNYGVKSGGAAIGGGALKGAGTGAALGSYIGPWGTVVGAAAGAIYGGITGAVGNNKAKSKRSQSFYKLSQQQRQDQNDAVATADPIRVHGSLASSYYAMGGTMKGTIPGKPRLTKPMRKVQPNQDLLPNIASVPGRQISRMAVGGDMTKEDIPYWMGANGGSIHIKPENRGKFTAYKERTGKTTEEALHSSDPHVRKMANFAKNAAGWKKGANGGSLEKLSSQDTKVTGNSHATGGVKFPSAGVELEGGETVNNNFVFSKQLGFAQQQEKIARATGKVEKQPDTVINRATLAALQRQTEGLKTVQEITKAKLGIPNDIEQKGMGGKVDPQQSKKPIVVHDKNDHRLKAYQDSLTLAKLPWGPMKDNGRDFANNPMLKNQSVWANTVDDLKRIGVKNVGVNNGVDNLPKGNWTQLPHYKMPNQPVVYQPVSNNIVPVVKSMPKAKLTAAIRKTPSQPVMHQPSTMGKDTSKPLSPSNPLMVEKRDGSIAQWGNDLSAPQKLPPLPGVPPIVPSNKALSTDNTYTPSRDHRQSTKDVATIKPSYKYGKGGKLKMAMGGYVGDPNPKYPLPDRTKVPTMWDIPAEYDLPTYDATVTATRLPRPVTGQVSPAAIQISSQQPPLSSNKKGGGINWDGAVNSVTPFISNISNAITKLPLPPIPILDSPVTPQSVDYSASRAEAVRQNRGANKSAEQSLNSGAAVSAVRAGNLAQQQRTVGQINEAEQNTNATLRGQAQQVNAAIKSSNNAKLNDYNNTLVERTLKGQQLKSENLANVENKIQGMARDKKMFDLEDQKTMLEALKDDTGASYRGARAIFAKHLSKESINDLDKHFTQLEAEAKVDRENNTRANKLQLAMAKKKAEDSGLSIADILGNVSTVTTAKEDNSNRKKK